MESYVRGQDTAAEAELRKNKNKPSNLSTT